MAFIDIDQVRSIGSYANNYSWKIANIEPPSVTGFPDFTDLDLRCASATLPQKTNQKLTIPLRQHVVHQPGVSRFSGQITLVFNETLDATISQMLEDWSNAIYDTITGAQGIKEDIESVWTLHQLSPNDANPFYEYKLTGVWLEDYTLPTLDNAEAQAVFQPEVTLSFDYFESKSL